jgi:hypothetical protein
MCPLTREWDRETENERTKQETNERVTDSLSGIPYRSPIFGHLCDRQLSEVVSVRASVQPTSEAAAESGEISLL